MTINFSNKKISKSAKTKKVVGDIESETLEEVNEVIEYSKKAKAETDKFKDNVDANYFTVVTFNNSKQLEEFFNKIGINPADKQYVDGKALAKKMGIDIQTPDKVAPGSFRVNKRLTDLTM